MGHKLALDGGSTSNSLKRAQKTENWKWDIGPVGSDATSNSLQPEQKRENWKGNIGSIHASIMFSTRYAEKKWEIT